MNELTQQGIITKIESNKVTVAVLNCSSCSQCSLKKHCITSEQKEKELIVTVDDPQSFRINDKVYISIHLTQGIKAVFYCYIFPLILLLSVTLTLAFLNYSDFISGISGIIVLIPYYFGLFLLKDKIGSGFKFIISKP